MGTTQITLSGVLVLHDCMIVVFQNNLSKKPLVIGLPMVSEHNYKCTSSALKREASEILQGSLSKKAVTDVEKKDENTGCWGKLYRTRG